MSADYLLPVLDTDKLAVYREKNGTYTISTTVDCITLTEREAERLAHALTWHQRQRRNAYRRRNV